MTIQIKFTYRVKRFTISVLDITATCLLGQIMVSYLFLYFIFFPRFHRILNRLKCAHLQLMAWCLLHSDAQTFTTFCFDNHRYNAPRYKNKFIYILEKCFHRLYLWIYQTKHEQGKNKCLRENYGTIGHYDWGKKKKIIKWH